MKKILLPLLMVACGLTLQAQDGSRIFYPGTLYGTVDMGGTIYTHGGNAAVSVPYLGIAAGCWVSEPLAFQLAVDGAMASDNTGSKSMFFFVSAEFKWDVNYTFFHVNATNPKRIISVYPLLGLGVVRHTDMELHGRGNGFQAMVGLQAPLRINPNLDATAEYKCFILPQRFNVATTGNIMHTLSVGLHIHQSSELLRRHTEYETHDTREDWFAGIGIGPNYSAFNILTNPHRGGLAMLGVAPEVMFGRNFSRYWSLRLQLMGLTAHEQYDPQLQAAGQSYRFSQFHADVMVNLTSLLSHKRGLRFNVMPYLGAGLIWRYDDVYLEYAADFGLFLRYNISRISDVYMDMKYVMVPPAFGGGTGSAVHFYSVGIPSLTMGYIYNFGRNTSRYTMPLNRYPDWM